MPTTHLCWTWRWRRCRCLYLKCWQSICVLSVKKMKQTVPTRCLTGLVAYHGVEAWCADDHRSYIFTAIVYKLKKPQHVTAALEVWNGAKAWFDQLARKPHTTQAPECITLAPQEPSSLVVRCWPEVARKDQCVKARTITTPCLNLWCFDSFHLTRSIPNSWPQLFSKHCPSRLQGVQVHVQHASNWSNINSIELVMASSLDDHEVLQAAFQLLKGKASLISQVIA